jgi:DNA mismatch repair ATPase MutS
MHVPIDVIRSLEIFQPRLHPSTHQKKGKEITSLYRKSHISKHPNSKGEGHSLVSFFIYIDLLNYTVSPGSTHLLKQWILRPSLNLTIINERQKSVAFFKAMDGCKGSFIKKLTSYLKHVKNMARILGRIYEHRAKVSEWHQLLQVRAKRTKGNPHLH